MMYSIAIQRAVKIWLDEQPELRSCGTCACGCDDLTRFICFGGMYSELQIIMEHHPEILEP